MILALCGTVEGRQLLKKIPNEYSPVIATVTTPYGVKCLGDQPHVEILEKKLEEEEFLKLIDDKKIKVIIDVSHPYAEKISALAMKVGEEKGILYLRYERKSTEIPQDSEVILAADFTHAAQIAREFTGKVFLTIGSNHIPIFIKGIGAERLIARVLPTSKVIKLCEDQGLTPDNIIALKGPFSEEMNRAMFGMEGVSVVLTKDSGGPGGTAEKIKAARAVGKPIIIVQRPKITYGEVYNDLDLLIKSLKNKI